MASGTGKGKWRLSVSADRPIQVMSLLELPTGHLTNLSRGQDGVAVPPPPPPRQRAGPDRRVALGQRPCHAERRTIGHC